MAHLILLMDYADEAFYALTAGGVNNQNNNFVDWYFTVHHNHDLMEISISAVFTQVFLEVCRLRELCLTVGTKEGLFTSVGTQM